MNKNKLYIYLTQEFKIQFQWLLNTRLASITVSNYQKYFVPIMCERVWTDPKLLGIFAI